jgi:hypothetical protein
VEVQAAGCGALWSLSADESARASIQKEGGTRALLAALQQHHGSKEVQEKCLGTIRNIARELNDGTTIEDSIVVDAVVGVSSALTSFPDSEVVQAEGCGALWTFSVQDIGLLTMESIGVLDILVEAMMRHPGSFEVQKSSLGALNNILNFAAPEMRTIGIVLPAVTAAVQRWPESAHLQQIGCSVLTVLVASPMARAVAIETRVLDYDVIEGVAIQARSAFPRHGGVQEVASKLLEVCRATRTRDAVMGSVSV